MIEAIVHQTWKDRNSIPDRVAGFVARVRETAQNLGFEWNLHDDNDVDHLIADRFPQYLDTFRGARLIERLDMWRYCALFTFGGFYLDIDAEVTEKFEKIKDFLDKPVLQVERDMCWSWSRAYAQLPSFGQFFMGFSARSPLLDAVIAEGFRRLAQRPHKKLGPFQEVLWNTGPVLFTQILWNSRDQFHLFRVDDLVRHHGTGSWGISGQSLGPHRLLIRKNRLSYREI
jgi:hypothetical protein